MRKRDRRLLKLIEPSLCSLEWILEHDTLEDAWNNSDDPNGMCWIVRLVCGHAQADKLRCDIRVIFDVEIRFSDRIRVPGICAFIRSRFPARMMVEELARRADF